MLDNYLESLKELERRSKDNILSFSSVLTQRLDELAITMVNQKMTDNAFIKLNELYYMRYSQEKNNAGMMFCILRIQQFTLMKKAKRNRHSYPNITFSNRNDEESRIFLEDKPNYYMQLLNAFKKKLIKVTLFVAVAFMIILDIVLHLHFLTGWIISIVIAGIVYFGSVFYIYDKIFDLRMNEMVKKVCDVQQKVDQSIQEA